MGDKEVTFLRAGGVRLEYQWLGPQPSETPTLVFLHEGLGSVSLWRDFPEQLAQKTGCGALVYSRAGYGNSDPVALPRPIRFMHDEADVLTEILQRCNIRDVILVGHSDGASIALIHAGRSNTGRVRGLVLEAPHVFTEPAGLQSIARMADIYRTTDLKRRLERHHGANTEIAFWGWNQVWLHPEFSAWNIEGFLPTIRVPILIIQGEQDEYGTVRQVKAIQQQVLGPVEVLLIPECGHVPHREHRELVLSTMTNFVRRLIV